MNDIHALDLENKKTQLNILKAYFKSITYLEFKTAKLWSNSEITICWINDYNLEIFYTYRVTEIQSLTDPKDWN